MTVKTSDIITVALSLILADIFDAESKRKVAKTGIKSVSHSVFEYVFAFRFINHLLKQSMWFIFWQKVFVEQYIFVIYVHISNTKTKLNSVTISQFTQYYLITQGAAKLTDTFWHMIIFHTTWKQQMKCTILK